MPDTQWSPHAVTVGAMSTKPESVSREVSELYISKINNLISAGRESLIESLVSEYDRATRSKSRSVEKALG